MSTRTSTGRRGSGRWPLVRWGGGIAGLALLVGAVDETLPPERVVTTPMVVLAYNDLGMHCMNADFADMLILPPFNTLRAQVVRRSGGEPDIMTEDVTVSYTIPGHAQSAGQSNFWRYWPAAFGPPQPPNVGVTGSRLAGTMEPGPNRGFEVVGVPLVPIDDMGREDPYPVALITVRNSNGTVVAQTQTVVPVSTEMSCNLCHDTAGITTAVDILRAHDCLHGTDLENQRPVVCATCHSDNALGMPGQPGISSLSSAMHSAHAPRMGQVDLAETCYACHPGVRTNCQRDVHSAGGVTCTDCHGDMVDVGNPLRNPWVDEPRCGSCHTRPGFQFEQPGTLYRNSVGHSRIQCAACHGSPHAITPATTEVDNLQATSTQGYPGVISNCTVCHSQGAPGPFFHRVED